MAKFRFRLAKLQQLRELHRDELRGKLAEASKAAQILQDQSRAVEDEIGQIEASCRQTVSERSPNVNTLLSAQRYQTVLRAQLATLRQQAQLLEAEIERRRQAVVQADQQVKILEKLHKRKLQEHSVEQMRKETKVLDEVAARCGKEGNAWQV